MPGLSAESDTSDQKGAGIQAEVSPPVLAGANQMKIPRKWQIIEIEDSELK